MIEVLVTIVIIVFGLLGAVGLQTRLQTSEMESYQRAQALELLNDMASRIAVNRGAAISYVTSSALGAGMTCPTTSSTSTLAEVDLAEWCNALQGAAEAVGTSKAGAMLGGRGCVEKLGSEPEYLVTVAWQGLVPVAAPATSVTCGSGAYHTTNGSACDSTELCRRTVTTVVRIASLI